MSKRSTLNYLINSYQAGKREVELLRFSDEVSEYDMVNLEQCGLEPPQNSIDKILSFALQYDVLQSEQTGSIELNLN